jgi:PAS domain S-box-containing protein
VDTRVEVPVAAGEADPDPARTRDELHAFFTSPSVGVAFVGPDTRFAEVNDRLCAMLGYPREELVGRSWKEITHPDEIARDEEGLVRMLAGHVETHAREKRYLRKDGSVLWAALSTSPVRRPDGTVRAFVTILQDLTERRAAEEALVAALQELQQHITASPLAVIGWDSEFRVTSFSKRAEELFGWRADEVIGKRAAEVPWVPEADWPAVSGAMHGLHDGTSPSTVTCNRNVRKDGAALHCEWYSSGCYAPDGRLASALSLVLDVTDRKAAFARLRVATRLANLGAIVASVTDKVSGPLGAAIADQGLALRLVRDVSAGLRGTAPIDRARAASDLAEAAEAIEGAQESGERISEVMKSFTAFGRPDERRVRVRLMDVAREALRWLPSGVSKAATLQLQDGGAPEVVASPGQLAQVIVNLVTNAANAMPPGRPGTIVIRTSPGGPGWARLEVRDDGAGIPPERLARLLDPILAADETVQEKGIGLGLAAAHFFVTAHGGTLSATSVVGAGANFRVDLPAADRG